MLAFFNDNEIKFNYAEKFWYVDGSIFTFVLTTDDRLFLKHNFEDAVIRMVKRELGDSAVSQVNFKVQ